LIVKFIIHQQNIIPVDIAGSEGYPKWPLQISLNINLVSPSTPGLNGDFANKS
jgi:hypothetical protein